MVGLDRGRDHLEDQFLEDLDLRAPSTLDLAKDPLEDPSPGALDPKEALGDPTALEALDLAKGPLEDPSPEALDQKEALGDPTALEALDLAKDPLEDPSPEALDLKEALGDPTALEALDLVKGPLDLAKDPSEGPSLEALVLKEATDPAKDPSATVDSGLEATVDSEATTAAVVSDLAMAPEASDLDPGLGVQDVRVVSGAVATTTTTSGLETKEFLL